MFDIGFWELLLIGIIALVVIGPERLPQVARQAGKMVGKVNRFVNNFKDDISKEVKADELKKTLATQAESLGIHEILEDTKEATQSIKDEAQKAMEELQADADPKEVAKLSEEDIEEMEEALGDEVVAEMLQAEKTEVTSKTKTSVDKTNQTKEHG